MATRASSLLCISDEWAAYQLDTAVSLIGNGIENALHETDEHLGGDGKTKLLPKYTLSQLLEPGFRLPAPGMMPEGDLSLFKSLGAEVYDEF